MSVIENLMAKIVLSVDMFIIQNLQPYILALFFNKPFRNTYVF